MLFLHKNRDFFQKEVSVLKPESCVYTLEMELHATGNVQASRDE